MDYSNTESTDPAIDIEPTVVRAKNRKFREIKVLPRWRYLGQRRITYDDHEQTCALLGETPFSKHAQGHVSAAKLKGSPEYRKKVEKMSERRKRIRHHEPLPFTRDVSKESCGCSYEEPGCCWCSSWNHIKLEYGQRVYYDKPPKPAKKRPCDKACAPLITTPVAGWTYRDVTRLDTPCEPLYFPRRQPDVYTNTYYYDDYYTNAFYDFYP
jgi:hypothetical protein